MSLEITVVYVGCGHEQHLGPEWVRYGQRACVSVTGFSIVDENEGDGGSINSVQLSRASTDKLIEWCLRRIRRAQQYANAECEILQMEVVPSRPVYFKVVRCLWWIAAVDLKALGYPCLSRAVIQADEQTATTGHPA